MFYNTLYYLIFFFAYQATPSSEKAVLLDCDFKISVPEEDAFMLEMLHYPLRLALQSLFFGIADGYLSYDESTL